MLNTNLTPIGTYSSVTKDSSLGVTASSWQDITSITLPAGTYDIDASGTLNMATTGTTCTFRLSHDASYCRQSITGNSSYAISANLNSKAVFTVQTTVTLQVFLSALSDITYAKIEAVRVK